MPITIRNQKPATLYDTPLQVLPSINPQLLPTDYVQAVNDHIDQKFINPLFVPINPQHPVQINDVMNGQTIPIDKDTISHAIQHLWSSPTIDVTLQDQLNEIYRQGIQYHAPNEWYFEEQILVEALTRCKLPVPMQKGNKIIKYSIGGDIIPAAKNFLATNTDMQACDWFANIGAFIHDKPFTNYLLVTVKTANDFNDFKQSVQNFVQMWMNASTTTINKDVMSLLTDFDKINIANDLSSCVFLPHGGGGHPLEHDAYSFTRILMYALAQFEQNAPNPGSITCQPTNMQQLYRPENIIFLNLENYAHATVNEIKDDWEKLTKAFAAKKALRFASNKKLLTAKAVNTSMGGISNSANSQGKDLTRLKNTAFSGKPVTAVETLHKMRNVIQSQVTNQVTHNSYKTQQRSFMRPNRRHPDDINAMGKISKVKYRPDIHAYLDTSGSISETMYRDAVMNLIALAKKINCDMYITSFSHYVSQTSLLKTKDRSVHDIYKQFLSIPKVSGGTDFEQVWNKIDALNDYNQRQNKSHQINFIITDFGYSLSQGHRWDKDQASVKNTYYVPISTDQRGWRHILSYAKQFLQQMVRAGDTSVRNRMLM